MYTSLCGSTVLAQLEERPLGMSMSSLTVCEVNMYKRLGMWAAAVGEELVCDRLPNDRDSHAVAVIMNYLMNLASLLSWTQLLSLSPRPSLLKQ